MTITTRSGTSGTGTSGTGRVDVAIVGGGLAGLTAACVAARAGATVEVLEARTIGGRARSATSSGFVLNEGAHALYRDGRALAILRQLGVDPAGGSPDPATYRLVWDGDVVPFPAGPAALAATPILGVRSKSKLAAWYPQLRRLAARAEDVSVREWLDDRGARADLRRLVLALLRLGSYAATPERAAVAPLLRQLALGAGGVVYVHGGWQSVVERLSVAASTAGATICDHEPVVSIDADGGGWVLRAGTRSITARSVVLAAGGPAVASRLLGDDPAGWVDRAGPVQRAAVLDIGGAPAAHAFLLSADEPLYLSTHAPVAALAPEGQHLVTAMRYLAADDHQTAVERRASLERHAAHAGAAAPNERIVDRFLREPVVTWGSPVPGIRRPAGDELAARGLWVAGDWVGEHLLADASVDSGARAGLAAARRSELAA
jgi:phytoene dehydrogenase-like protein